MSKLNNKKMNEKLKETDELSKKFVECADADFIKKYINVYLSNLLSELVKNRNNMHQHFVCSIETKIELIMMTIEAGSEINKINDADYLWFCNKLKSLYDFINKNSKQNEEEEEEENEYVSAVGFEYNGALYGRASNNDVYNLAGEIVGVWDNASRTILFRD